MWLNYPKPADRAGKSGVKMNYYWKCTCGKEGKRNPKFSMVNGAFFKHQQAHEHKNNWDQYEIFICKEVAA